jgi:2'-hydroxyisoflavone reductase
MRVLILGGTVFLGRHVAAEALARGHEVTVFHRGKHGRELFAGGVEHLIGDRGADLSALEGRRWDVAVDTSGYRPDDVAASSALLAAAGVEHLAFVSTCNVYPEWPAEPVSEESRVWTEGDDYGPNKAACERAAEAALPGRVAALRAGLLCGPHDNVFRLPWWVRRIARGGEVLAPGDPDRHLQLIDARDLAGFILDLGERREPGVFNATSPPGRTTMREVLEAAVAATGSDARLTWVPDDALVAAGAEPWTEVPLWIPEADAAGTWRIAASRAETAGLRCRPAAETVRDVCAWLRDGGPEAEAADWLSPHAARGMSREREEAFLAAAASRYGDDRRATPTRSSPEASR